MEVDFSTTSGVHHQAGLEPRQLSGPRDGGWETRDGARSGARLEPDNCLSSSSLPSLFLMIMIMMVMLNDDDDYNWIPEPANCVPLLFYPSWPGALLVIDYNDDDDDMLMNNDDDDNDWSPGPANCFPPSLPSLGPSLLCTSWKAKQKLSKSGPKDKISKNCIAESSSVTYKSILRAWRESKY